MGFVERSYFTPAETPSVLLPLNSLRHLPSPAHCAKSLSIVS